MSIKRDDRGIGGFVESLLAIMVVTVAVVLFTVTMALNLVSIGEEDGSDGVRDASGLLVERVMDECATIDGDGLSFPSLQSLVDRPYPLPNGTIGYVISVHDLSADGAILEIRVGSGPKAAGPIGTMKLPVSLVLFDGRSHAGILEVSVW
jgi:hypothetical protein